MVVGRGHGPDPVLPLGEDGGRWCAGEDRVGVGACRCAGDVALGVVEMGHACLDRRGNSGVGGAGTDHAVGYAVDDGELRRRGAGARADDAVGDAVDYGELRVWSEGWRGREVGEAGGDYRRSRAGNHGDGFLDRRGDYYWVPRLSYTGLDRLTLGVPWALLGETLAVVFAKEGGINQWVLMGEAECMYTWQNSRLQCVGTASGRHSRHHHLVMMRRQYMSFTFPSVW